MNEPESKPEPPLTLREKYAAERALADLKMACVQEKREQKGYCRVTLLPAATFTICGLLWLVALRVWVILPLKECRPSAAEKTYYSASADFLNGDLNHAEETVTQLLKKNPASSAANILMAKIHLARGQRQAAVECLRTARETALERREIDGWIAGLESSLSPASGFKSTLPGN